jgi:hypothetical protein
MSWRDDWNENSPWNSNDYSSDDFAFGAGPGFDIRRARAIRAAHGIICALVFIFGFPIGSILLRILPGGRWAVWTHAIIQIVSFLGYCLGAAMGIYLARMVRAFDNPRISFHPIIGIIILAFLFLQPPLGLVHHKRFKQLGRRTAWSHAHRWNGRIMMALGFVNGGLGLWIAGASDGLKGAYAIVAGIMGVLWVIAAFWGRAKRGRQQKEEEE